MKEKPSIPPEAAAIMAAMVRLPPKPHEEMKLGKSKGKAGSKASQKPKGSRTVE
jgi:hypothetical protein